MCKVTVGDHEFNYAEVKLGTNRAIRIWTARPDDRERTYKFDPNPHDHREYNKDQAKFYQQMAEAIGALYNNQQGQWPAYGTQVTIPMISDPFTLDQR